MIKEQIKKSYVQDIEKEREELAKVKQEIQQGHWISAIILLNQIIYRLKLVSPGIMKL